MISKATLSRLPIYLNYLRGLHSDADAYISATAIAKALNFGEVTARKDLAAVSGGGKPKIGYKVSDLIEILEQQLGYNSLTKAVLVGAGKLGRALLEYKEFERYGVKIEAAFDSDFKAQNRGVKTQVFPMEQFENYCKDNDIRLGIITVDVDSAQPVCDRMIKSGIKAVWNFAPCNLKIQNDILIKNENLALSLAHLNITLNLKNI